MPSRHIFTPLLILLTSLYAATSVAQTPAPLEDWIGWIKDKHPEWECARDGEEYTCLWPGILNYSLKEGGADFSLSVELSSEQSVPLPARDQLSPHSVKVTGVPGTIFQSSLFTENGTLFMKLPQGKFTVTGSFSWSEQPAELPLDPSYGIVTVAPRSGQPPVQVQRAEDSVRVLSEESGPTRDSLSLTIFRRFEDGSPLLTKTLLSLRVSGTARSVTLGKVIPQGSAPVTVQSELPYQLTNDGTLSVQLVPGQHNVSIDAVLPQPVKQITLQNSGFEFWPAEETVIWSPNPAFRTIEVKGASPLSTELSQVPDEWKGGAAYVAKPGSTLELKELSRGEQSQPPSSLTLSRYLWIDLNGRGFTVQDRFSGQLNDTDRLDALPSTKIGRATVAGMPALIASGPNSQHVGIEVRNTAVEVEAISRIEDTRTISAVGWSRQVENLSILLALPPSWRLLDVGGAYGASGSWIGSWTLLDVFMSMLVLVGVFQLFGRTAAILTGCCLFLNHGEFLAPRMLLVHLLLLTVWQSLITNRPGSSSGLHHIGPWHLLCRILTGVTFAAWTLQSLAFVKLQITQLLYPQLQAGTRYRTIIQEFLSIMESSLLVWPYLLFLLGLTFVAIRSIICANGILPRVARIVGWGITFILVVTFSIGGRVVLGGGSSERSTVPMPVSIEEQSYANSAPTSALQRMKGIESDDAETHDLTQNTRFSYENKVLLSGPALPQWRWRTHAVYIDGPVHPGKEITFYLLSPGLTRVLCLLRSISLIALTMLLFTKLGFSLAPLKALRHAPVAIFLVLLAGVPGRAAHADFPSPELLAELEQRLQKDLCERAECATISDAALTLTKDRFRVILAVSSDGVSKITVPGPLSALNPEQVKINGAATAAFRRNGDDFLEIRTPPGTSSIEVEGRLPEPSAFTVQFPQLPLFLGITTDEWYFEGLSPTGTVSESVRFTDRSKGPGRADGSMTQENLALPAWVTVLRKVTVADQISVQTTVTRVGDFSRAAAAKVPLLSDENVTTTGLRVENNVIFLSMPAGTRQVTYSSSIPYRKKLVLRTAPTPFISEEWSVHCTPIVHCTESGLTPTQRVQNGLREFRWLPFPDEAVSVEINPLTGIAGDLLTVDSINHRVRWGGNLLEGTVDIRVRATQQQTLILKVPNGTEIRSVTVNGQPGSTIQSPDGTQLLLNPGTHTANLSYSKAWNAELFETAPEFNVSAPLHNVTIEVAPSADRWLLWAGGVAWGPAVVFWGKLICVVALCLILVAIGLLPTSLVGGAALGIGLATLPLIVVAVPLVWLMVIGALPQISSRIEYLPRWLRITAFSLLTVAALALFYHIVQAGLVFAPPMLIAGNGSTSQLLRWFVDHADQQLPQPWVLSLPLAWWRICALLWSTWLVIAVVRWLKLCVAGVRGAD